MAKLYLVDIENICGEATPNPKQVLDARMKMLELTNGNPENDFFVLGCHVGLRRTLEKHWPFRDSTGRINSEGRFPLLGKAQKDGGDRAIRAWLEINENRLTEFDSVVIASGDHFFADIAINLQEKGKLVSFVALSPLSVHKSIRSLPNTEIVHFSSSNMPEKSHDWDAKIGSRASFSTNKNFVDVVIWNRREYGVREGLFPDRSFIYANEGSELVARIKNLRIGEKILFDVGTLRLDGTLEEFFNAQ